jgi:hypothetical protein
MEILELFPFFVLPFFFTFVCVLDLEGGGEKLQEGVGVSFFSCDARRWGRGACFLLVSEKKTGGKTGQKKLFFHVWTTGGTTTRATRLLDGKFDRCRKGKHSVVK